MGDLSTPDCSWKKMVIAKANNKWISTIIIEQSVMNNTMTAADTNSEHEEIPLDKIKKEREESCSDESYEPEIHITQCLDPLSLLQPIMRQRRRSSGANSESPDDRATRLARMSAYAAQRLANESPEQRANRLKRMSEYAAKRLAHETTEQRAKRLSRMSAYAAKRLASETPEQRQARLARMSAYAARRQAMKKVTGSKSEGFPHDSLQAYKHMPNQS